MSNVASFDIYNDPLEHVCDVALPRFQGRFSPSSVFREGAVINGIKVRRVGDEFMKLYLPIPFISPKALKSTPEIPESILPCWKTKRPVYDSDLFYTWIGTEKKTTDLVRIFQMMNLGHDTLSLMRGCANFAFVVPVLSKAPRVVYWNLYLGEWHIHAIPGPVDDIGMVRKRSRLPQGVYVFGGVPDRFPDEKSPTF